MGGIPSDTFVAPGESAIQQCEDRKWKASDQSKEKRSTCSV